MNSIYKKVNHGAAWDAHEAIQRGIDLWNALH